MEKTTNFSGMALVAIFLFIAQSAFSQTQKNITTNEGFFMLISNKAEKKVTTVQFYNNEKVLIYEETVTGVRFNLCRKKHTTLLNNSLEKALLAWNEKPELQKEKGLISDFIKDR